MDTKKISAYIESEQFGRIIAGVAIFAGLLMIFRTGMEMGYRKAAVTYQYAEQYYKSARSTDYFVKDIPSGHGVSGTIAAITPTLLVINDNTPTEKIVRISEITKLRKLNQTISVTDLGLGDTIIVLGTPSESGEIFASLIRVMPPQK